MRAREKERTFAKNSAKIGFAISSWRERAGGPVNEKRRSLSKAELRRVGEKNLHRHHAAAKFRARKLMGVSLFAIIFFHCGVISVFFLLCCLLCFFPNLSSANGLFSRCWYECDIASNSN